jgi:hypothetical protein
MVLALVAEWFLGASADDNPADFFDLKRGVRFYKTMHVAANVTVQSEFSQEVHQHCLVNVAGSALEILPGGGLEAVAGFLGHLRELEKDDLAADRQGDDLDQDESPVVRVGRVFKVTRLDLAFDGVPFTVLDCDAASVVGVALNIRSQVRKGKVVLSRGEREAGEDGDTFYWGGRASKSRMVRVYDRRPLVRLEMEWRGNRSDLLARQLLDLVPSAWPVVAMGHLRDFIDFIDHSSSSNRSRCVLLPWWEKFVHGVDKIRVKIERPVRPLVEKIATQKARLKKGVHKLVVAFGAAYVAHHLVEMGAFKMTPADHREVAAMRALGESDPDSVDLYPSLRGAVASAAERVRRGSVVPAFLFSSSWLAADRFKS